MGLSSVKTLLIILLMPLALASVDFNEDQNSQLPPVSCESKIEASCYHLRQGITAFREARFQDAVASFQVAAAMDLTSPQPRLCLATAYAQLYIPGGEGPKNIKLGRTAISAFEDVLRLDAKNLTALASIGQLYYNMKEFDKSKEYQRRRIQISPENPEPYYWIGVIDWAMCYPPRMKLRKELRLTQPVSKDRPDLLPPLPSAARDKLAAENLTLVQEGIEALQQAIELKPNDDAAMAYLNLMYREKADLEPDPKSRELDLETADKWVERALNLKNQELQERKSPNADR